MDSSISQFNITYHSQQDRLLLRIGLGDNGEVLLWLTRRVLKSWWPLLQEANKASEPELAANIADPLQRQITQEFAREAAIQKLDFSEPYGKERENRLQHSILIKELRLIYTEKTPSAFEFEALNGRLVKINLTTQIILGLIQMLIYSKNDTGWDLELTSEIEHPLSTISSSVH